LAALELLGGGAAPLAQPRHHLLHELLGRGRAGGDADGLLALEPLALQERRVVDEIAGPARALRELAQAIRIRAGDRADDDEHVAAGDELLHGVLPVLRGVADVFATWARERRETRAQRVDDGGGVVHGQGSLGDEREAPG